MFNRPVLLVVMPVFGVLDFHERIFTSGTGTNTSHHTEIRV
jgi:hypothetical protein